MTLTPVEYEEYEKKCNELEKSIQEVLNTIPAFVHCNLEREEVPNATELDGSVVLTITTRVSDVCFKRVTHSIIVYMSIPNERITTHVRNCIPHWVGQIYGKLVEEEMEKREK